MAYENESKLNETVTKVFEYIDWFKEYDSTSSDNEKKALMLRYPNEISSLLISSRSKCEKYFEEVVDQPIYMTNDYLRLRKFLVHWYSAYNCSMKEEQQVSDIEMIDRGLLLQSLGYKLHSEHNEIHQKTLCTELSDMYAQKGTPLVAAKVLSLLDISNFTMFEYWLQRDDSDNALVFTPIPIDDISYNTGFNLGARPVKPYNSVVDDDPHWYTTETDIETAEAENQMGLPSMTPYIGIISANDWVKDSRMVMAWVNRHVTNTYDKFLNLSGYDLEEDRKYYFYMIAGNISILELYLAIGYTYNELYGRTNINARNNIDEMVPHYNGDDDVLLSEVQYITEHNHVFKRTYDRDERESLLQKSKDDWHTLNPITKWTHAESAIVLQDVNPELKSLCDNMLASGQGFEFLKDLLTVLDYYVKHDLGLTSYTSLFMLYDPLQENRDSLDKVFNFFKPYPTRLIEAISYMVINDIPGDCMATKEVYDMEIYHRVYEYYNNLYDLFKQRIFDKHYDIAGRADCETMFCDLLNQIIIDRHLDYYYELDDKLLRIHIDQALVEYYILVNDLVGFKLKEKIGWDRYGFNEMPIPGDYPWPSALMFIVNQDKVFNKLSSHYPEFRAHKIMNLLTTQFHEWYVLSNDKFNMSFVEPFLEKILPLIMKDVDMYNHDEKFEDQLPNIYDELKYDVRELFVEWYLHQDLYHGKPIERFSEKILPLIMKDVDMYGMEEYFKEIPLDIHDQDQGEAFKELFDEKLIIVKDDVMMKIMIDGFVDDILPLIMKDLGKGKVHDIFKDVRSRLSDDNKGYRQMLLADKLVIYKDSIEIIQHDI